MPSVTLADRAHIAVSGRDAPEFLQSLITTDLPSMPADAVRPGVAAGGLSQAERARARSRNAPR